ncbi:MAG: SPOR domain-containing protein [Spirochaetes bacterium]|nr:SPOR domain-containing protein [Spirochaetota bacterium]
MPETEHNGPQSESDAGFEKHIVEHDIYVVNLSKGRIALFSVIIIAALGVSFIGGYFIGTKKGRVVYTMVPGATASVAAEADQERTTSTKPVGESHAAEGKSRETKHGGILSEIESIDAISRKKLDDELSKADKKTTVKTAPESAETVVSHEVSVKKTTVKNETTAEKVTTEKKAIDSEAPANAAAVKKAADAGPGKGYFIQIAVSSERSRAEQEAKRLKSSFPNTFVREEIQRSGVHVYKIKMGRFSTRDAANEALGKLKKSSRYKDSYIYFSEF